MGPTIVWGVDFYPFFWKNPRGGAGKLKKWVYESGGLRPADELYRNFRGSDPTIEPLLRIRGFATSETEG